MDSPLKIAIYNLGCRVNAYESFALADIARARGLEVVPWGEKADFAVVNSCALTVLAQAKTRQAIRIFARANPDSPIAVTGCYAQIAPGEVGKISNVKIVAGNPSKSGVIDMLLSAAGAGNAEKTEPATGEFSVSECGFIDDRVNLKIQDGCDNCCSYCVIPQARGRPRSRSFGEIIEDAKNLAARGAREITLTGINITKFSTPDGGLVELVDALDEIGGLSRIRIGSIEPQDMPVDALLERAADDSHKLQPHFHVCAQSLCDRVLKAMRRKNTAAEFLEFVRKAKDKCADISIGADIICGHPFERDCDYLETKEAMLSSGLSYAHVFTFSPRPKTLAATMGADTPPPRVRRMRSDDLRAAAAQMHERFMASQLGKVRPILFEKPIEGGRYLAYTDNYIRLEVCGASSGLKNTMAFARLESIIDSSRVLASAVRCGK